MAVTSLDTNTAPIIEVLQYGSIGCPFIDPIGADVLPANWLG